MPRTAKKTKTNGRALLKKVANNNEAGDKKKKSKVPQAAVDKDTQQNIAEYRKVHAVFKDAKASMAALKEDLLPVGAQSLVNAVNSDGKFHSSVCMDGKLNFTSQNKYSELDEDAVDNFFTEAEKEQYFTERLTISLKDIAQTDDVLNELVQILGEEKLTEWFNVGFAYKPNEAFHNKRWTDDKFRKKVVAAKSDGALTTNDQLRVVS